jgi:hypothetical protein
MSIPAIENDPEPVPSICRPHNLSVSVLLQEKEAHRLNHAAINVKCFFLDKENNGGQVTNSEVDLKV